MLCCVCCLRIATKPQMPEKQCVEIEDRAFEDEQYMQEILDVESDMIDEYVRGEFSAARRKVFEEHFLASAERRRKLEFARALAEAQKPAPVVIVDAELRTNPITAFFRSLSPVNGFALATVVLLMFAGAAWFIRDGMKLRAELSQLRAERQTQEDERRRLEGELASKRRKSNDLTANAEKDPQTEAGRSSAACSPTKTCPVCSINSLSAESAAWPVAKQQLIGKYLDNATSKSVGVECGDRCAGYVR